MKLKLDSALSYLEVTAKNAKTIQFANLPPECIIQMNVDNQIQSFNCYPEESHIHKKDIKNYLKPLTFRERKRVPFPLGG